MFRLLMLDQDLLMLEYAVTVVAPGFRLIFHHFFSFLLAHLSPPAPT